MYNEYIKEKPCPLPVADTDTTRRRLHGDVDPTYGPSQGRTRPGRRLKGAGGKADAASSSDNGVVPQMSFQDFAGLFVCWLFVSLISLSWAYIADHERFKRFKQKWRRKAMPTREVTAGDVKPQLSGDADVPYDLDNSSSMLRKVLSDLDSMKRVQREVLASQTAMSQAFKEHRNQVHRVSPAAVAVE